MVNKDIVWMLGRLPEEVVGIRSCALVSADGIPIASAGDPQHADQDQLASVVVGCATVARQAAAVLTGERLFREVMLSLPGAVLLVQTASDGAVLGVCADDDANMEVVSYEMDKFINGRRDHLVVQARTGAGGDGAPDRL